jgi:hypothetical protein
MAGGKAVLNLVLKLLEPLERLAITILFFNGMTNISTGVISSMILVVSAAMSLIITVQSTSDQKTAAALPLAVLFSVLSGLTLSTRNVL